jgi:ATP-dependent DNA helicase RecG
MTEDRVKWNLNKLKTQGQIRRVGPDKGGYWEIIESKE